MLRESLNSSKFIVAWHRDREFRELVANHAKELLEFEPVWILLSAMLADGVLTADNDEKALEHRDTVRAASMLRSKLRELVRAVDEEQENA